MEAARYEFPYYGQVSIHCKHREQIKLDWTTYSLLIKHHVAKTPEMAPLQPKVTWSQRLNRTALSKKIFEAAIPQERKVARKGPRPMSWCTVSDVSHKTISSSQRLKVRTIGANKPQSDHV